MARRNTRRPGRPLGESNAQREALLDAAAWAFAQAGREGVTLKQVADRARVSAPLASYYFGGKTGLYESVLAERFEPRLAALLETLRTPVGSPPAALSTFIQQFDAIAARNPWLPDLLRREPAQLARLIGLLLPVIASGQASAEIRGDLSPQAIALSLMSLCSYAWIARDTLEPALGIDLDAAGASRLTLHHLALLRSGLHKPRQESSS
jgi:TetR/AcrR family transcriptional regulator